MIRETFFIKTQVFYPTEKITRVTSKIHQNWTENASTGQTSVVLSGSVRLLTSNYICPGLIQ